MKGFIQKSYEVSGTTYEFVRFLTSSHYLPESIWKPKIRSRYHRFLGHLFASTLIRLESPKRHYYPERVPISSILIRKEFGRDFDVKKLDTSIIVHKYHWKMEKTYRYEIRKGVWDEFFYKHKTSCKYIVELIKKNKFHKFSPRNLLNSRKLRPLKNLNHGLTKEGYKYNEIHLINSAANCFEEGYINLKKVEKWLRYLSRKEGILKSNIIKDETYYDLTKKRETKKQIYKQKLELKKVQAKLVRDVRTLSVIARQQPKHYQGFIYIYKPAYSVQKSGRLTERQGGFQNATRYMKHLLTSGINRAFKNDKKFAKIRNFDLKSCQAFILHQFFEDFNIKCKWLDWYISTENAKEVCAKRVGISEPLWKKCFYSVCFGAVLLGKRGAVYTTLEFCYKDKKKVNTIFPKVIKELREIEKVTSKFKDLIYFIEDERITYRSKGYKFWKNACSKRYKDYGLRVSDNKLIDMETKKIVSGGGIPKVKRQIIAFMVQGQEAAFIHNLTLICAKNKVKVYHNEHDGLIAQDRITDKMIKQASKTSGYRYPQLIKKPLCPEAERKEYIKLFKN